MAHNMHEQYTEREQTQQVAQIIIRVIRTAGGRVSGKLVNRSQEDVNEFRRQWVLAFKKTGSQPWSRSKPACAWYADRSVHLCLRQASSSSGAGKALRAGDHHADVMAEYWKWRKLVFRYPSSEQYPWPKPVYYHICLELRRRATDGQLSQKELEDEACEILGMWEKRVLSESRSRLYVCASCASTTEGADPCGAFESQIERMKACSA